MDARTAAIATGLCAMTVAAWSAEAPFAEGAGTPVAVRIAAARAAVIARPATGDENPGGWEVVAVLRDTTGGVLRGEVITPDPAPPAGATLALIVSATDRNVSATALSPDAARYLVGLPGAADRAGWVARHLGADDPFIAADAFAELACLSPEDLRRLADRLPAALPRRWLDDPATPTDRIGLYGYLLGLCGDPADAARLRDRFYDTPAGGLAGGDGLAAGYLLLGGEPALAELEARVLLTPETHPLQAAAVLEAVSVLRNGGPIAPERMRSAVCCGLNRPDTADLAVCHLLSARDWAATAEVTAALRAADPTADAGRALQVTAARYLLACRSARDAPPADRRAADAVVASLSASDPDLLRRAALLAAEPGPVRR